MLWFKECQRGNSSSEKAALTQRNAHCPGTDEGSTKHFFPNNTDVSEARDLTDVSEDAAHNYLQVSSSRDLSDVTLMSEDKS